MIFAFQTLFLVHSDHELLACVSVEPEAEGTIYILQHNGADENDC